MSQVNWDGWGATQARQLVQWCRLEYHIIDTAPVLLDKMRIGHWLDEETRRVMHHPEHHCRGGEYTFMHPAASYPNRRHFRPSNVLFLGRTVLQSCTRSLSISSPLARGSRSVCGGWSQLHANATLCPSWRSWQ